MSLPANRPPFAAVLLAGGRSTRMGCDKAGVIVDGVPLWQRQLEKLRALDPRELLISGRSDGPYAGAGVEIIEDAVAGLGPLGGVAAALHRAESPLVLVLAVDLIAMTPGFLMTLVREDDGAIPQPGTNFEPLAAVYPKAGLVIAEQLLGEEDRSMQRFARRLIAAGLARARAIEASDASLFKNVNRPEDLS